MHHPSISRRVTGISLEADLLLMDRFRIESRSPGGDGDGRSATTIAVPLALAGLLAQADCGSDLLKSEANASRALGVSLRLWLSHSRVTSIALRAGAFGAFGLFVRLEARSSFCKGESFLINLALLIGALLL
jgi:hypothetical protein